MPMKERVINLLRGSRANHVAAWLGFGLAVILSILAPGFIGMDQAERGFFYASLLFGVTQCFTLSKTMRDRQMADVLHIPLLKGTDIWFGQVVASWLIATVCAFYAVATTAKDDALTGGRGLAFLAVLFSFTSAMNLAKSTRDRNDSELFSMDARDLQDAFDMNAFTVEQICKIIEVSATPNLFVAG